MPELPTDSLERIRGTGAQYAGPAGRTGGPVVPRGGYLGLLAGETTRTLLEALWREGPLERSVLRRCVPYVSDATFERAHRSLVAGGLVASRPLERERRRRVQELTPLTPDLLQIAREVEAVELWAPIGLRDPGAPPLIAAVADHGGRLILRELLDGPLSFTELRALIPELAHGTFADRLAPLRQSGLVQVQPGRSSQGQRYKLSELAPALARAVALAARFRWRVTPLSPPWLSGDLSSFLRLLELTPKLRAPRGARGTVRLHVITLRAGERGWQDAEIALEHGRISQRRQSMAPPSASMRALPPAWYDAALDGNSAGIEIEGDVQLAHTLLAAITAAVDTCPRP